MITLVTTETRSDADFAPRVRARRTLGRIAAVGLAAALMLTASGCGTSASPSASPTSTSAAAPAGVVEDTFQIGEGATIVDLYTDASCPHCKIFDAAAAESLQEHIESGAITLHLHPINYVSAKRGDTTDFSTRVMNLLAVASDDGQGDVIPAVYSAIVAAQVDNPDDTMPDNDEIIALAEGAGLEVSDSMRTDITDGRWNAWVQSVNDATTTSPLPDGAQFTGVPTLLIDASPFEIREDGTDAARLLEALGH